MKTPLFVDPFLTGIAVAYRNERMIADSVLPRVPVTKETFRYFKFEKGDKFTLPNTHVGRKGKVREIEFGSTETTGKVESYGLEDPIPNDDLVNAEGSPVNPLTQAAENLTDLIELDREVRVANMVFSNANYASGLKADLQGAWSNYTNSDPVDDILSALDLMLMRANKIVMGRSVYTIIRQHPKVLAAVFPQGGNAASGGKADRAALAALFEVDEVLIGEGWVNTAKRGQAASVARVWTDSLAMLFIDGRATPESGRVTFGFTAQWQQRLASQMADPDIGLRGGVRVRVGESVKELVTANDLGYLFEDCIVGGSGS